MKKISIFLICLALLGSLAACGGGEKPTQSQAKTPAAPVETAPQTPEELPAAPDPTVVIYFSRVGNTDFPADVDAVSSATLNRVDGELKGNAQLMAEWMADELGADLFEIQTEYTYPVGYTDTTDAAKQEQTNRARPALKGPPVSPAGYDTMYLVFPIWWGDLPMAVYSYLDAYDLTGKTVIVSVTHEGSSFSQTVDTVRGLEPGADVVEGLSLRGGSVAESEGVVRQFIRDNR